MKLLRRLRPISLMLVLALLLSWGAAQHSPAMDDIAHLASGICHWDRGQFDLYKVNPPLVRMLAALPVLAAGPKTDYRSYSQGVGVRSEFSVMDDFTEANGSRAIGLVTLARCGLIPLALVGGYVCYRWARELYSEAAGTIALALWCFSPNALAYAQILAADAGAAALGVMAAYSFWKWLREPAWDRAILAGIALGFGELTKTTWVVLFGLWPLLWLVVRCSRAVGTSPRSEVQRPKSADKAEGKKQKAKSEIADSADLIAGTSPTNPKSKTENPKSRGFRYELVQIASILALGVFCINAGYDFEGSGTKLRNYLFLSRPLTGAVGEPRGAHIGNRFAKSWLGNLPVPLPKNYVEGIDLQWHGIEMGKPSYLRGRWQERGWWYWYLYALAVKVPLGTWGLFLLAVGVRVASLRSGRGGEAAKSANRPHPGPLPEGEGATTNWRDELVLLAPAAAVLVLVSSQTGFSRYIRYVLPMFPFVFIWISSVGRFIGMRRCSAAFERRGTISFRVRRRFSLAQKGFCRGTKDETRESGGPTEAHAVEAGQSGPSVRNGGDESPRSKQERVDQSKGTSGDAYATMVGIATIMLLTWSVGSSLWYAPHWMSYFNELAGGPMGGPAHLIDAQVDWGQDLLYLKKWLDSHPEAKPLGVIYFGPINPALAGIDFILPPKGVVVREDRNELADVPVGLKPGWYAVSVNYLYGYDHFIYDPSGSHEWVTRPYYTYFRRFRPVATAGYSIYIYHLTAREITTANVEQPGAADDSP